mmetsp:Transcript_7619/g.9483  ORF Transcript_7619/g.9483 Transcript_7619/m.9483 type:complete len:431 (+) Transcript_7619:129-1421(+)
MLQMMKKNELKSGDNLSSVPSLYEISNDDRIFDELISTQLQSAVSIQSHESLLRKKDQNILSVKILDSLIKSHQRKRTSSTKTCLAHLTLAREQPYADDKSMFPERKRRRKRSSQYDMKEGDESSSMNSKVGGKMDGKKATSGDSATKQKDSEKDTEWLSLVIGNSRFHWAMFSGDQIVETWDLGHLGSEVQEIPLPDFDQEEQGRSFRSLPMYVASVVPDRLQAFKQRFPAAVVVTLVDLFPEIMSIYPTMGVDRALALRGAGRKYSYPAIVVDCGSALTYTAADDQGNLVGGAIMPGLRLQRQVLNDGTAALPLVNPPDVSTLPDRWAMSTVSAIGSGIFYGTLAAVRDYLEDWLSQFSTSAIAITGGDAELIQQGLIQRRSQSGFEDKMHINHHLGHYGIEYFKHSNDSLKQIVPDDEDFRPSDEQV